MLDVIDLTPVIGSEVVIDTDALVAGTHADEIRELLVKRGVLVVRGANLDDDQQRAFTQTLGELRMGTPYEAENRGMLKIVDIAGSYFWHVDGTYTDVPPFATTLTPRALANVGGDTEFASTYAAFEDLPEDEQEYLKTLEVVHSMKAAMIRAVPEPTVEQFTNWMNPAYKYTQPLVWQHRSGRNSLVIGATSSHVVGMHPADGIELLDRLLVHSTQDKFVYKHKWQMGDLVMWDNTGTMHRVRPFDLESGRTLHRFTLEGTESLSDSPQLTHA